MTVERKYERDIDILLAEEFAVSPQFGAWFLEQSKKFTGVQASVSKVCVSKSDSTGESDLVVVYKTAGSESSFALQIEDKINAPVQPEQEARYRLRADAEVKRGIYSEYEVILCAPESYCLTHPEVSSFDSFVSYEDIGRFLEPSDTNDLRSLYRAHFIATAARAGSNTYVPINDPVTNAFWDAAYQIATREFPDLEMKPLKLTKDSTWINMRPREMPTQPRRIYVSLKGDRGYIDLTFTNSLSRLFSALVKPLLEDDMTVHQTGKSAAIRIVVSGFNVTEPNEAAKVKIRDAFASSVRLIRFYRRNRLALDKAASESLPDPARRL
jgi:hypothetical protein